MRVRILSGHLIGCVQDFPQTEGEVLVATGFGELVADDVHTAAPLPVEAIEPAPIEQAPVEPVGPAASDVEIEDAPVDPVDPVETPE